MRSLVVVVLAVDAVLLAWTEMAWLTLGVGADGGTPLPLSALVAAITTPLLVLAADAAAPRTSAPLVPLAAWTITVIVAGLWSPTGRGLLPLDWRALLLIAAGVLPGVLAVTPAPPGPGHRGRFGGALAGNRAAMPAIPDEHIVRVLRPFVAATGPVLTGLRDADPFRLGRLARRRAVETSEASTETRPAPSTRRGKVGRVLRGARARVLDRLATSKLPGTPRWQAMTPDERDRWWVSRVGRFTSVVASIPGIGGALARRLPVSDILGLGAQGLVLCAIASDHGMNGRDEQVRLLASVLFARELSAADLARLGDAHGPDVERQAGELAGDASDHHTEERGRLSALARAVWRMGRTLWGLGEEMDRRPRGKKVWRLLANLPVVGALASYRSERSGLKRAARSAARWVAREQGNPGARALR